MGQIKYAYNYESKCSFFFFYFLLRVCVCGFLKKHLNSLLKMYLISTFFKVSGRDGWFYCVFGTSSIWLCSWNLFSAVSPDVTIVYARYINRSFTVILFSQNKNFIYSVYRLSFSIFPAWQAQNNLNVHRTCTVAFVRNGIGLSIKLSLFYNFHSFVFIAKTSGLLTLRVHGSYPKSLRKNPDTRAT